MFHSPPSSEESVIMNQENASLKMDDNATKRSAKRPAISSPPGVLNVPVTKDEVCEIVKDVIHSEVTALITQINANMSSFFGSQLKDLKSEISEMRESMQSINQQYEEFTSQHQSSVKTIQDLRNENNDMRSTLATLGNRVNHLEQQARIANIEIQCVPEKKNENLLTIVTDLAKVIQCELKPENIVKCTRVAKFDPAGARPRSVVVQLSSPAVRDKFLASAFAYNKSINKTEDKLNTTNLGIGGEKRPIYVLEQLSPTNKALHAATRSKAKSKGYKYVWTRYGKIYVRKSDDSDRIWVKDENSLDKLV